MELTIISGIGGWIKLKIIMIKVDPSLILMIKAHGLGGSHTCSVMET